MENEKEENRVDDAPGGVVGSPRETSWTAPAGYPVYGATRGAEPPDLTRAWEFEPPEGREHEQARTNTDPSSRERFGGQADSGGYGQAPFQGAVDQQALQQAGGPHYPVEEYPTPYNSYHPPVQQPGAGGDACATLPNPLGPAMTPEERAAMLGLPWPPHGDSRRDDRR